MAIAEDFTGLQLDQLIAAPLRGAMDAGIQLADSTMDFIRRVGLDQEGKVRTAAFRYQRQNVNEDGTCSLDEMEVALPLLAVVPIPNLQVDEVNILFDIEVKHSERQSSDYELGARLNGGAQLGIAKANITGSVSAHKVHTRSTDHSAKYHVDIRAVNHGIPEGLARVFDLMAANAAPILLGSAMKDENGQNLSTQAERKAEKMKALRREERQLERCLEAARDKLSISLSQLRKAAAAQLDVYKAAMLGQREAAGSDIMKGVAESWNMLQNRTGELIQMIAHSGRPDQDVSGLFCLKAVDEEGKETAYGEGELYYGVIAAAQRTAVSDYHEVDRLENCLLEVKAAYNGVVADISP